MPTATFTELSGTGDTLEPFRDHLPALDGLRGIAVLMVLAAHSPWSLTPDFLVLLRHFLDPVYLGVDIFFVLSGFLITRILIADKIAGRPISHFLLRRVLRIFPIAYLLLAIMLFFRPWWEIGWCAIYLSNYRFFVFDQVFTPLSHYWSLAVEEHFYLLWPWVVYGLSFRNSRAMVCYGIIPAAIVSGIVLTLVLPSESARMFLWYGTQSRMASLALGALFAFGEGWLRHDTRRAARMAAVMFGAFLLIHQDGEYLPRSAEQMIRFLGFAMLSGCLVLTAINMGRCRTPFSKCLDNPPLRYVGRISYGLYLYHAPFILRSACGMNHPRTTPSFGSLKRFF
jgi:peptidoglycan/LPS O-acetylase OafA/YrhL